MNTFALRSALVLNYERFILFLKILFLFMSMGQDYAPELRTPSALFSSHGWNMSMEPWWIDADRVKLKISENNLFQCHFFCQPGSNPGFRRRLTAWAMVRLFSGLFRCSNVPYHKKNYLLIIFWSFFVIWERNPQLQLCVYGKYYSTLETLSE
jgi:hypothetical protein